MATLKQNRSESSKFEIGYRTRFPRRESRYPYECPQQCVDQFALIVLAPRISLRKPPRNEIDGIVAPSSTIPDGTAQQVHPLVGGQASKYRKQYGQPTHHRFHVHGGRWRLGCGGPCRWELTVNRHQALDALLAAELATLMSRTRTRLLSSWLSSHCGAVRPSEVSLVGRDREPKVFLTANLRTGVIAEEVVRNVDRRSAIGYKGSGGTL